MEKKKHKAKQSRLREKNLTITGCVILITALLMVVAYRLIYRITFNRALERMEEAAHTVMDDIANTLSRDSVLLNAIAEIIGMQEDLDGDGMRKIITEFAPLTTAKRMYILLPDNTVLSRDGSVMPGDSGMSFEQEAARGEHISDRMVSMADDSIYLLRHFVPIVKDGETIALLYATTRLNELPEALNIANIYNGQASVFLVDRKNGDFLMDTFHEGNELGNLSDYDDLRLRGGGTMHSVWEKVMKGETGSIIFYTRDAQEAEYFYYAPITGTKWVQLGESQELNQWAVAVSVPEREAFAHVFKIRVICYLVAIIEGIILIAYFLWTFHNTKVTMEKAILEERLVKAENAERAKTMFLSNMSHDIRTPMNAIIGYATLAATNIDKPEKVSDYLSKILSSSNHLLSLINDVLDMSRIESGRVNIDETACSLPEILVDLRNILLNQMHAKQLEFYIDTIDVTDEDIFCDKLHLNQVLLNLLSNAIKFTPAGGSVSLIIRQKECAREGYASYEIRVKDTGIGMSPEFLEHVFEPFEREENSTVSGIQGTGLGMAIAKNIVEMMGGTISVTSEQGKGTEYVLNLDFRLQTDRKQPEIIKELNGARALVADDDFNICDSVAKMLSQLGLHAEWTLSGKEAVLHAKHAAETGNAFDAYIIDLMLPDLNGLEVVRRIRAAVGTSAPIVILTAYDWSSIESEAREAGVTAFCSKPVFLSTLRATLVSAVSGEREAPKEAVSLPRTADDLKGKRLLLVEDNELNREIAVEILTESGFEVQTAADGTEAVEIMKKAKKGDFDLILMDVQMPVMNGYDATKAIRALEDREVAQIPIIAMTANAFEEDRRSALESGMNDHVAKPLDMDKLFAVLEKYLRS